MTMHERSPLSSTATSAEKKPDTDPKTLFYDKIEHLKQAYQKDLQLKIELITTDWKYLQCQWNRERFENLYRIVHNLAGSGATFGFATLGQIAREITTILKPMLNNAFPLNDESHQQITDLFVQLRTAASLPKEMPSENALFLAHCCATKYDHTQPPLLMIDCEYADGEEIACQSCSTVPQ